MSVLVHPPKFRRRISIPQKEEKPKEETTYSAPKKRKKKSEK